MKKENRLIWIDLEMTGLDTNHDVILEIASIVTDNQLNIVAEGPVLVIHQSEERLKSMNEWVLEQHTKSGLLDQVRTSEITIKDAQEITLTFLREWCEPEVCPLAGNSVWNDRAFLQEYMPDIASFFHYRMIDVSSFKEMVLRWYSDNPKAKFEKKDEHRALDDIKESIAELRYYRQHFFV